MSDIKLILNTNRNTRFYKALLWFLFLLILSASARYLDLSLAQISVGLGKLGSFFAQMVPPRTNGALSEIIWALGETVAIAFAGTMVATMLSVPLGFLCANNIVGHGLTRFSMRRMLDIGRGIDVIIWALIFVSAVGLGPFAGILAIIVADTAVMAKVYSEAIESVDKKQVEGLVATGAGRLSVIRYAYLPQVAPEFFSYALYVFESNTRAATILGIVGAGGIGYQLSERMRFLEWNVVFAIVLMIFALVIIIDFLSKQLRKRIS